MTAVTLPEPRQISYVTDSVMKVHEVRSYPASQVEELLRQHEARVLESFKAELLASLEEPTPEMLDAFQKGFLKQLVRRKHKGGESAELGGLRAMLEVATTYALSIALGTTFTHHKESNQ